MIIRRQKKGLGHYNYSSYDPEEIRGLTRPIIYPNTQVGWPTGYQPRDDEKTIAVENLLRSADVRPNELEPAWNSPVYGGVVKVGFANVPWYSPPSGWTMPSNQPGRATTTLTASQRAQIEGATSSQQLYDIVSSIAPSLIPGYGDANFVAQYGIPVNIIRDNLAASGVSSSKVSEIMGIVPKVVYGNRTDVPNYTVSGYDAYVGWSEEQQNWVNQYLPIIPTGAGVQEIDKQTIAANAIAKANAGGGSYAPSTPTSSTSTKTQTYAGNNYNPSTPSSTQGKSFTDYVAELVSDTKDLFSSDGGSSGYAPEGTSPNGNGEGIVSGEGEGFLSTKNIVIGAAVLVGIALLSKR